MGRVNRAARRAGRSRVRLYGRPDCHLCDEARAGLEAMRSAGLDFEFEEIDIESDDELLSRLLERIPVVELDGEVVSELGLDPDGLRARLDTLSRSRSATAPASGWPWADTSET